MNLTTNDLLAQNLSINKNKCVFNVCLQCGENTSERWMSMKNRCKATIYETMASNFQWSTIYIHANNIDFRSNSIQSNSIQSTMILLFRWRFNIVSFTYVTCTFTSFDMADKHIWPEQKKISTTHVAVTHIWFRCSNILFYIHLNWFRFFFSAPPRRNRSSSLVAYLSLSITQWWSLICIRNTLAQQLMKFSLRLFDFSPLWCDECFSFCPSLWLSIREKIFHLLISFYFYFFLLLFLFLTGC